MARAIRSRRQRKLELSGGPREDYVLVERFAGAERLATRAGCAAALGFAALLAAGAGLAAAADLPAAGFAADARFDPAACADEFARREPDARFVVGAAVADDLAAALAVLSDCDAEPRFVAAVGLAALADLVERADFDARGVFV
jgi:hypothetical protein